MAYQDGDTTSSISIPLSDTQDDIDRIDASLKRMAITTGVTSSATSSASVPDGYAPSFEGIYILTPSGIQTRLFDYTDSLHGDEKADVTDIDKDGDMDYIFLLDNALFIKYNHTTTPPKTIDTASEVYSVPSSDIPTAPNYFSEVTHEVGYVNVNFTPARETDRVFRLEFYDHMLEWDMDDIGTPDPNARKTIIDLVVRSSDVTRVNADLSRMTSPLYADRVSTDNGSIRVVSTNYFIHSA